MATAATRIKVMMKNHSNSAETPSSSSSQNWPSKPSRQTHSPLRQWPPFLHDPPQAFLAAMESSAERFTVVMKSAHWWICSVGEISCLNYRMQWSHTASFGSLNSLPSKPGVLPHGNFPSRSAESSLGLKILKSKSFSPPRLYLTVQVEFWFVFKVFH